MYITLEDLALAATTNTEVAELTAALVEEGSDFLSLSCYVAEDGYINLKTLAEKLIEQTPTKDFVATNHYDRFVSQYLGENYKPLTLAQVNVPKEFKIEDCDKTSKEVRELFLNRNLKHLELFAKDPNIPNLGNSFALISPEGDLILNEAAISKRLEFLEFVKTITVEEIQQNPAQVAMKVLYMFNESCKPLLQ